MVTELADTYRVFVKDWVIVYASTVEDSPGRLQCVDHFNDRYEGRVEPEDERIVRMFHDTSQPAKHYLELRLWTQKGEFKTHELAVEFVRTLDPAKWTDGHVVKRNSRNEQILRDYGKVKLSIAEAKGRVANSGSSS